VERRRLQLTKVHHPGKVLGRREAVHDCVVHNITGLGVCIEFDLQAEQLPKDLSVLTISAPSKPAGLSGAKATLPASRLKAHLSRRSRLTGVEMRGSS
jgi:hypothetical protein